MAQAVTTEHPAVVLRSHFNQLRALLAVAMVGVVGLAAAVVILATDDSRDTGTSSATLIQRSAPATFDPNSIKSAPGIRYDGGPEEGSRGIGR